MASAPSTIARYCLVWFATITLSASYAPQRAHAEPASSVSGAEAERYAAVIRRAVEEFQLGNYAEARGLFLQAHALYPNARTFRGIGVSAFELRSYAASVKNLEAALSSREKPLTEALRTETEETLNRARGFIAHVKLELSPANIRVLIDGIPAQLEASTPLLLEVGDHVLDFKAPGFASERRALTIAGGEQLELPVSLTPLEERPNAAGPREERVSRSVPTVAKDTREHSAGARRWYKSPWLWTAVTVLAAGAGVGIYLATRPEQLTRALPAEPTLQTPPGGVLQGLRSR